MPERQQLLDNNRRWARAMKEADPDFFARLSAQQRPSFLWIGCSDSRVPANQIVGLQPGEVFVHRNVGNVVTHSDLNCMAVLQVAVEVLRVRHVIVCGHYGCAGVQLAVESAEHGLIDNWLSAVKDVYHRNEALLERIEDPAKRLDLLTELHVKQQVANVAHTPIVQNAWARGASLKVSGWVYRIEDGLLRDLEVTLESREQLPAIYRMEPPGP